MAKTIQMAPYPNSGFGYGVDRHFFAGIAQGYAITDEANSQVRYFTGGTASRLHCRIAENGLDAAATHQFRINGANGNMVISIPAATTGDFYDTTHTDTIVHDDLLNHKITFPYGGTNSMKVYCVSFTYDASGASFSKLVSNGSCNVYGGYGKRYNVIQCYLPGGFTADSWVNVKFKVAGTLHGMSVTVVSNPKTSAETFGICKNGLDGNIGVSVPATTTGVFEDSTNSDTISVDDTASFYCTDNTGSGTANIDLFTIGFTNTGGHTPAFALTSALSSVPQGTTTYGWAIGTLDDYEASEATVQEIMDLAVTWSYLSCKVYISPETTGTTIKSRINGADGNQILSIAAGTTGTFIDTTHTDSVAATDKVSLKIDAGTGTQNFRAYQYSSIMTVAAPTYALTVTNGTGDGNYEEDEVAPIVADAPAAHKEFDKWTGDTGYLDDDTDPTTNVTMPAMAIAVTATYKDIFYDLTVVDGSGSGSYLFGADVDIEADAPPSGYEFAEWGGDVSQILDKYDPTTKFSIGEGSWSAVANYSKIPPVANFSGTPVAGTAPLTVDFTDSSTEVPTSWLWDFGDLGSSILQNPSHVYAAAGTYTVKLTATNAGGSDDETKVGYITVTDAPVSGDSDLNANTMQAGGFLTAGGVA